MAVELKPEPSRANWSAALNRSSDRLMKRYKAAQEALKVAKEKKNEAADKAAQDELDALMLFKTRHGRISSGSTRSCRKSSTTATRPREAIDLLQAPAATAGVRPRA